MISVEARAGAEVEVAHTIVLHLLGAVLVLARAQHHEGAKHHTAGAQNRAAEAQQHTAGAQNHAAGARNRAAGAQHHTAGAQHQPRAPWMEVPIGRPMEKVHLFHAVLHHHHGVQALVALAAMARIKACCNA